MVFGPKERPSTNMAAKFDFASPKLISPLEQYPFSNWTNIFLFESKPLLRVTTMHIQLA